MLWGDRSRRGPIVGRSVGLTLYVALSITGAPAEHRLAIAVVALAGVAALFAGGWAGHWYPPLAWLGPLVFAGSGDLLFAWSSAVPGWLPTMFVMIWIGVRLPLRTAVTVSALCAVGLTVVAAVFSGPGTALGMLCACFGFAAFAWSIRENRRRAETAERLLASEREASLSAARADLLAERQRLAREIHDILAHTLSAQVVQLEGARLMLTKGAPPAAVLARVEQAQRLAREGLDETRRAVASLRGRSRRLDEALRQLADDAGATVSVRGDSRPLTPEVALAVERTVQEALTNIRKHASGATAQVCLAYHDDACEVEIVDTGPAHADPTHVEVEGADDVLAGTGGGYGLTGMRERAELLGGELRAGTDPAGEGFRVWLRIPA